MTDWESTPLERTDLEAPQCPFCDARDAELVSLFGCQALTSHYRCRACGSYFEAVRANLREEEPAVERPSE